MTLPKSSMLPRHHPRSQNQSLSLSQSLSQIPVAMSLQAPLVEKKSVSQGSRATPTCGQGGPPFVLCRASVYTFLRKRSPTAVRPARAARDSQSQSNLFRPDVFCLSVSICNLKGQLRHTPPSQRSCSGE
jgi:hypothetical protein